VTRARYIFTQKDPTKYLCAGCLPQIDHSWDKRQRCRSLFYCLFPLKPLIIFLSSNKSGAQIKITNETRIYNYQFTISILQTCTCGSCYNNFQLNNHGVPRHSIVKITDFSRIDAIFCVLNQHHVVRLIDQTCTRVAIATSTDRHFEKV
jgi:hypothetical protein